MFKSRILNKKNYQNENINLNNGTNIITSVKEESPKNIKKEEDEDSDEEAFKIKDENVNKNVNEEEGEELSELSAESAKDEIEGKDFLYAQYDKVHRVKTKWKCSFKDAVLQINGKEYIFEKVVGELERNW